ncbi:hypothetical protein CDL12_03941 [Handroanthus impetiginosus]|uniref:Uncharacterized protein n=1 Tax=Handroanthus impetiginosus TaxID=429701 RepID=A0A2G9I0R0_9LAMI|nr:hypothetical protein CDL12_03941 [Handroanthus impetiginosus]
MPTEEKESLGERRRHYRRKANPVDRLTFLTVAIKRLDDGIGTSVPTSMHCDVASFRAS